MTKKDVSSLERLAWTKSHMQGLDKNGKLIGTIQNENCKTEFMVTPDGAHWSEYDPETKRIEYIQASNPIIIYFKPYQGNSN